MAWDEFDRNGVTLMSGDDPLDEFAFYPAPALKPRRAPSTVPTAAARRPGVPRRARSENFAEMGGPAGSCDTWSACRVRATRAREAHEWSSRSPSR